MTVILHLFNCIGIVVAFKLSLERVFHDDKFVLNDVRNSAT